MVQTYMLDSLQQKDPNKPAIIIYPECELLNISLWGTHLFYRQGHEKTN